MGNPPAREQPTPAFFGPVVTSCTSACLPHTPSVCQIHFHVCHKQSLSFSGFPHLKHTHISGQSCAENLTFSLPAPVNTFLKLNSFLSRLAVCAWDCFFLFLSSPHLSLSALLFPEFVGQSFPTPRGWRMFDSFGVHLFDVGCLILLV